MQLRSAHLSVAPCWPQWLQRVALPRLTAPGRCICSTVQAQDETRARQPPLEAFTQGHTQQMLQAICLSDSAMQGNKTGWASASECYAVFTAGGVGSCSSSGLSTSHTARSPALLSCQGTLQDSTRRTVCAPTPPHPLRVVQQQHRQQKEEELKLGEQLLACQNLQRCQVPPLQPCSLRSSAPAHLHQQLRLQNLQLLLALVLLLLLLWARPDGYCLLPALLQAAYRQA